MKLALLVIDMQKCFVSEFSDRHLLKDCCDHINHVSGLMRKAGHTVILIQDVEDADSISEEELGFIDEIDVQPADLLVKKVHSNAFWETELAQIVDDGGFDLLVLSGLAAEYCVLFTYNGAVERGYTAAILQNGVLSVKPERIQQLFADRHVVSYPVIEAICASHGRGTKAD